MNMTMRNDRGIALVLSMLLMLVTSLVAASLLFMAKSETLSTSNYKLMSQARYGAESGVQKAANFFLYSYTAPDTAGADPIAAYTFNGVSPVTWNGQPVRLSANAAVASNYPVAAVQTAFSNAAQGSLASGNMTVNYRPYATLMAMRRINVYGGGQATIQTWLITSDGSIATLQPATVEVTAVVETPIVPAHTYAAFATSGTCGALQFSGGAGTDSYNSAALSGGNPVISQTNGHVGTNGNLTESGSATIHGTLSTPRIGVGGCSAGNVDAFTSSGGAAICPSPGVCTGGIVQLPAAWTPVAPTIPVPSPVPPTSNVTINSSATCATLGLSAPATCSGSTGHLIVNPNGSVITLGNLSLSGGATLVLNGGTYNLNSLSVSGGTTLTMAGGQSTMNIVRTVSASGGGALAIPANKSASLMMNIVNTSGVATPVSLSGGAVANASYDPTLFQIQYGGTGTLALSGGAAYAAMVFAPNAPATFSGGTDFYGSIVASTVTDSGSATLHYDTNLASSFFTVGNMMLSSFSWQRY